MGASSVSGETVLTPAQVAAMFQVSPRTVSRWVREGKLVGFRTPGGVNRFRKADVEKLRAEFEPPGRDIQPDPEPEAASA